MANEEHLEILWKGAASWREWRKANPEISPNLSHADLRYLDLRGYDFTRADLTGATMQSCNLEGTEFRDAGLAAADLASAEGLLPGQLAGADLERARLPAAINDFLKDTKAARDVSENAQKLFIAMLAACLYSLLTIGSTTDVSLVTNRASFPLPIIQTSIPIVSFYLVAPLLLLGIFFYCNFYLQKLWEELASLPAIFTDGKPLQSKADPWLLSDLVRSNVLRLRPGRPFLSHLQAWVSILLAWWSVPATLLLFWARYLPRHDSLGTMVQAVLAASSITGATVLYRLAAQTLQGVPRTPFEWTKPGRLGHTSLGLALAWSAGLLSISYAAINGVRVSVRGSDCWAQAAGRASWVPSAMSKFRYSPFADLSAADLAVKPPNWVGKDDSELERVTGLQLYEADLRYANLNSAFLPVSVLSHARLDGAELASANLQQTKLVSACLKGAILAGANLTDADLTDADVEDADFRGATVTAIQLRVARHYARAFYDDSLLSELGVNRSDQDARLEGLKKGYGSKDWVVCEANQLGNTPGKGKAANAIMEIAARHSGPIPQSQDAVQPPTSKASLTVAQLARLYHFPAYLDGHGQRIGILEFGGKYIPEDLRKYFARSDAIRRPTGEAVPLRVPTVTTFSVDGAKQALDGAEGEVMLDVETLASLCPKAEIAIYFSSFTERGWLDAIYTAVSDPAHKPSVLLVSWGLDEGFGNWTKDAMQHVNEALHSAADAGVTVVVAAGDDGAAGGNYDRQPHVDFPASSPWVLAVGGTMRAGDGINEIPWKLRDGLRIHNGGATGGGISKFFPIPPWQFGANVPTRPDGLSGRGVPDVAAAADWRQTEFVIDGRVQNNGGSGMAAGLWAGLVALLNEGLGRDVGYFNEMLYKLGPAGILHSVTGGDNGSGGVKGYQCSGNWNPCTGWGSPDGEKLLEWLQSAH